jgi:hypothetical protein
LVGGCGFGGGRAAGRDGNRRHAFFVPPYDQLSFSPRFHHHQQTGYSRYYKALSEYLSSQLGDKIEVVGMRDRGVTGNFEVTVPATGKVLHSRQAGQGKAETTAARAAILVQIEDLLEEQE